ncbi:SURF1 family protein [Brevundimonas sp.]|uniref:SURF1 family protein n=1 Tax=Brevundimonas sp. TaxID=1871086 RepID=UPI002D60F423|nr:SURF1 family cytochrome oxidase biogenesis protein [Brevundimonas sp.]HYC69510.1 SURF1 family cytochrome oxidase biogenesis protein [Brevundimonas sp.]
MADTMKNPFPWVLTVASALVFAVLIALGVWQVQRLQWKQGLIAAAASAAARPAAPLDEAMAGGAPEFRRVVIDCPGLATAPYVELRSIQDGSAGVRLISACAPDASDDVYLVDRGFVADEISARPPVLARTDATRIEAVIRAAAAPGPMAVAPEGRHFYARDNAAMARALGLDRPVAPWTLYAVSSSNPEWLALKPSAPPASFSNNHLAYAITWFGLALALIAFYVALLRRKAKSPSREERPS